MDMKSAVDQAVAAARDLPDLLAKFRAIDPTLANQLQGKALLASKSPWGTLVGAGVGWAVAHFGLGWDQVIVVAGPPPVTLTELVTGACILAGSYAMRWITSAPIARVLPGKSNTTTNS